MKTRRTFLTALGLSAPAALLPRKAAADPPNPTQPYRVPAVTFTRGETIRGDANSFRLRLQVADNSIQDYVRASYNIIAQGHREGFSHFRVWYRRQEAARQAAAANQELIAALFGFALKQTLNIVFPESGEFIKKLKEAAVWAYDKAAANLGRIPRGDVNRFLDGHQARVEELISSWLVKAEEVRRQDPGIWTAAKNEFILEQLDAAQPSSELGPQTKQLLEELGVPPPSDGTLWRFKGQIMAAQITEALWKWDWDRMNGSRWETHNVALSEMARYFWPQNPEIYCVPQVRVNNWWRTPTCRKAISEGNLAGPPP
jgi:hypothetical protein